VITVYRRHLETCPHKRKGRKFRTCNCPIHIQGIVNGFAVRKSLDIRDWRVANQIALEIEAGGLTQVQEPISTDAACKRIHVL
jgi:hypothetical protein